MIKINLLNEWFENLHHMYVLSELVEYVVLIFPQIPYLGSKSIGDEKQEVHAEEEEVSRGEQDRCHGDGLSVGADGRCSLRGGLVRVDAHTRR